MNYLRLDEICNLVMGQSPNSNSYNQNGDGIPFFQGNADFGGKHPITRVWCNNPIKIVTEGTLLISVRAPIGALNFAIEKSCIGRGLAGIIAKDGYDLKYIYYALKYKKEELNDKGTGSTFKAISKSSLGELLIKNEPLEIQKKCVKELDLVYTIIENTEKQIKAYDNLIKSRFVEMFGDPVQNTKRWVKKPFLDMGNCKNGMNFHYEDTGIEINCLGVGDFKDLTFIDQVEKLPKVSLNKMPSEEYLLKDGDIVFVRSNGNKALVGRSVAVYPGNIPTTFSGFCIRYRKMEDAISVPYLLRVLKTDSMRQKMAGRGANIQNLNQQILGTLEIPVPPIELQNQFAAFVRQVDKLRFEEEKRLKKTQLLFDSLMQQYFG